MRLAIVGLGRWGQRLVDSVQGRSTKVHFTRAVARTPGNVTDYATLRGLAVTADFTAVLTDPTVDGVVLATPHSQHAEQTIQAAQAGKHVFCEKPVAMTGAEAAAMVEACRTAGVTLAVGHNRRFLPSFAALSRLAKDGLGTLLHIEGHFSAPSGMRYTPGMWRADREESPAGGMGGMGIHVVDAMIALGGPVASIRADSRRRTVQTIDDTTSVFIEFASGMTGTLVTLTSCPLLWTLRLSGSQGRAEMLGENRLIRAGIEGPVQELRWDNTDIERLELEGFADAVAGTAPYPVTPEQAIHGAAVFEAIVRSVAAGDMAKIAVVTPAL